MSAENFPITDFTGATCVNAEDLIQSFSSIESFIACMCTIIENYGNRREYKEHFNADGTTNVFAITVNGGDAPPEANGEYLIDLNGVILSDQLSTGNPRAIIDDVANTVTLVDDADAAVLTGSVPDPDVLTVRFKVTETFQDLYPACFPAAE